MRKLILIAAIFLTAAPMRAEEPRSHLDRVPRDAELVVSVRVGKLWTSELFKSYRRMIGNNDEAVAELFGMRPSQIDRLTVSVRGNDLLAFFTTTKDGEAEAFRKTMMPRAVRRGGLSVPCWRDESQWVSLAELDRRTFVVGPSHSVELYVKHGLGKDGPQAAMLKQAADHDVAIGVAAGESGFESFKKAVPDSLVAIQPLLKARRGTLVMDFKGGVPSAFELAGTFEYVHWKSAQTAAEAAKQAWKKADDELGKLLGAWEKDGPPYTQELNGAVLEAVKSLRRASLMKIDDSAIDRGELRFATRIRKAEDVGTLALCATFSALTRSVSSDGSAPKPDANLEKLAKAFLAQSKDGFLPPAILAKDGKTPLLSWRVALLPHLGDDAKKLYAEFKRDEPWDSDHNIRLVMKMPKVFAPVADAESARAVTPFQLFTGPDTLFPGTKRLRPDDVKDGFANTFLIVQATRPVPWTKPQDLEYDAKKPVPLIGSSGMCLAGPTAHVAFADGTVRVIPVRHKNGRSSDSPAEAWAEDFDCGKRLRPFITPAGGEPTMPEQFDEPRRSLPVQPLQRGVIIPSGTGTALGAAVGTAQGSSVGARAGAVVSGILADEKDPAEAVVRIFFENLDSDKDPEKSLALFLSPETKVTGISGGGGRDLIQQVTAKELIETAKKQQPTPHDIDTLTITKLGDSLASAAVTFHTKFVTVKAVLGLTREGGDWRIASYVWETKPREGGR